MARYKSLAKKLRLGKAGRRTKWAPFWTVLKVYGKGKRIHPARLTRIRRSWRRSKLKLKQTKRKIKSGLKRKKY